MNMQFKFDAFISYRHQAPDNHFARDTLASLEKVGFKVAIDERDFSPNATFLEEMERCVRESAFTLAVVSPRYFESGNTEEEAVICKVLGMQERRRRLIPLVIEKAHTPVWLFGIVGIDFTARKPFINPLDKLKAALRPDRDLPATGSILYPGRNPVGGRVFRVVVGVCVFVAVLVVLVVTLLSRTQSHSDAPSTSSVSGPQPHQSRNQFSTQSVIVYKQARGARKLQITLDVRDDRTIECRFLGTDGHTTNETMYLCPVGTDLLELIKNM